MRFTVAAFAAAAAIACSTSDVTPVPGAPYRSPTLLTRDALHDGKGARFLRGYETDAAAINNNNAEERSVTALSALHPNPTLKNKELPAAFKAPIRFVVGLIRRIGAEVRLMTQRRKRIQPHDPLLAGIGYIIPFIAIAGADMPHYTTWDDGSYSIIAQTIGGTWLCVWVLISSVIGNLGLFLAEMAKDGFQLAGMADSGLAPPYFAQRHPDTGVPRRAILLAFFLILFMGMFDFDTILGVDNFLSALSSLVEMSAAVRMRFSHPEIDRPYRVNLSDRSLVVAMVLPFTLGVFIMMNELTKSWSSFSLNVVALLIGYFAQKYIERHPYHEYSKVLEASLT